MNAMIRFLTLIFCLTGFAAAPFADEQPVQTIRALPFIAAEPGNYRLVEDLAYDLETGAAITVAADHVTIDLNNKLLRGTGGDATAAIGILAVDREGVTIKGGRVSGFYFGIDIRVTPRDANKSSRHVVSHVTTERNWYFGIRVVGPKSTVSDCHVLDTGGSTKPGHTIPHGVRLVGAENILRNCQVRDLRLRRFADGKGEIVGVHFDAAKGGICENNHFIELVNGTDDVFGADDDRERRFGLWINGGPQKDTFLRVSGNVFRGFAVPVVFAPGSDGVVTKNCFIDADTKPIRGKPAKQLPDNTVSTGGEPTPLQ